jgi:serine/threonine-protein kinase
LHRELPHDKVAEPMVDAPARFGAYDVVRVLGAGGMGTVYEVKHRVLGRRAAVKSLHPHLAQNARAVARFVSEGQAVSRIRHAAVIDVLDVGEERDIPFLVMELLDGEDLAKRLARERRLSPGEALAVLLPVLRGLGAAHDAKVIHRDLKPSNVILAADGPRLVDFGISRVIGEGALTGTDATLGTVHYMAPEQAESARSADERSDIYSFGVMLYECLSGERPYRGESAMEILRRAAEGKPPPLGDLPPGLEQVIMRAMHKDRDKRYASARDLEAALMPYALEASVSDAVVVRPVARESSTRWRGIAFGTVVALAGAVLAFRFFSRGAEPMDLRAGPVHVGAMVVETPPPPPPAATPVVPTAPSAAPRTTAAPRPVVAPARPQPARTNDLAPIVP